MLNELITKDKIHILDQVSSWENGITEAAKPLLEQGYINQIYVQQMITEVKSHGPYIVITPHVAIAHARPKYGVQKLGMSFLKLNHGVEFGHGKGKVELVIVLAATDNTSHLKALAELTEIIGDPKEISKLIKAKDVNEIVHILYGKGR